MRRASTPATLDRKTETPATGSVSAGLPENLATSSPMTLPGGSSTSRSSRLTATSRSGAKSSHLLQNGLFHRSRCRKLGRDIAAGIYAGNPGSEAGDSCYWARLSEIAPMTLPEGSLRRVKSTDSYFTVRSHLLQNGLFHRLSEIDGYVYRRPRHCEAGI